MRFSHFQALLVLAGALAAGCERSGSGAAPAGGGSGAGGGAAAATNAARPRGLYLDHAQTGLATAKIWVGPMQTTAEVCRSMQEVATGLMHRSGIGPEETMLFVFGTGERRSFYMRNVPFPISAAYIDPEGVIREVVSLKAMDETPVPSSSDNIQYVLEAAPDWFSRHGLAAGALVASDRGPLRETLGRTAQVR